MTRSISPKNPGTRQRATLVVLGAVLVMSLSALAVPYVRAQEGEDAAEEAVNRMPRGPVWGGGFLPESANAVFATSDGCAVCHDASDNATALYSSNGDDVSPYELWHASVMANSFRDPYWRAQVAREVERHPDRKVEIESQCLTCHGPMAHHTARISGKKPSEIAVLEGDSLARDGVSCTVCHQARPDNFGTEASYGGQLDIRPGRLIFGPFEEPAGGPMRGHTAYTAVKSTHMRDSALCGTCHTLRTHGKDGSFLEQAPYLEWRNSVFSTESTDGDAEEAEGGQESEARSCQECHMPDLGSMRIARAPDGFDYNLAIRDEVRGHAFVGGNALLLDMLRDNADELDVIASEEALERMAKATRVQLATSTARVKIDRPRLVEGAEGEGGILQFDLKVQNLCGHKFPSGYPSRRAWLHVEVRDGNQTVFQSGKYESFSGRLVGIEDAFRVPHADLIERSDQVAIYEMVAVDKDGQPTTSLIDMVGMLKDNRLLPRGWTADGPHADETAPVGIGEDKDFLGGEDTVHYRVALPDADDPLPSSGRYVILARLVYQTIPPAWAASLEGSETEEARKFLRLYDDNGARPEVVSIDVRFVGR